jgi:glucose-6-phosphate isomerase
MTIANSSSFSHHPTHPYSSAEANAAWTRLLNHAEKVNSQHLRDLFDQEKKPNFTGATRFERFSVSAAGLFLDYSKNRVLDETMQHLVELAKALGVPAHIQRLLSGKIVNPTENRAALHSALREPANGTSELPTPPEAREKAQNMRKLMEQFVSDIRNAYWLGAQGDRISDIVHIGIGGSDLGPRMVCRALNWTSDGIVRVHFASNIDAEEFSKTVGHLDARRTLFLICSKTFTTMETMANAKTARDWLFASGIKESQLHQHMVAISAAPELIEQFGLDPAQAFTFWDWVGGRFSLWSSVGLPIALFLGWESFESLLAGAHAMDVHLATAPLEQNMPVLLSLLGIWNRNFLDAHNLCIAPYTQALEFFPSWLQQLDMESTGKSVRLDGSMGEMHTSPVIFGQVGSNSQHAYFQMLHQGTQIVPFPGTMRHYWQIVLHRRRL